MNTVVDKKGNQNILVDQEDALSFYLQSLLGNPEIENLAPVLKQQKPELNANPVSKLVSKPVLEPKVESKVEPDLEIEQNNKVEIKQELKTHLTPQLTTELTSQLTPNFTQSVVSAVEKPLELLSVGNTPLWAMEEARCLLVKVAGLKVFIPASYICSIKNVTNLLKPSSKMPTWIYELVDEEDDDAIQVVNTQKLIFNGVKIRRIQPDSRTYVVLIDDGSWGLSCDAIGEVVSLKSEDVTWRSENTKRRWLAGTSSGNGAVILNVNQIESALIR